MKGFVDVHMHALEKLENAFFFGRTEGLIILGKRRQSSWGLGLHPFQIMDVMETSHCSPGDTGFLSKDLYNFFSRHKKEKVEGNNAEFVLKIICIRWKRKIPSSFLNIVWMHKEGLKTDSGRMHNRIWTCVLETSLYSIACTA
ncbi:hypothetical protein BAE44_0014158 [Dichanthelium oligosanthes]|uniref:Uncharacterized protein n=1 Tax=Dichanthelium oligosanthes TaxID=888268 RepID=A0A1E5VI58_9POAL|nr:hypothetical protein BAE44_0014158 [Dichanthelium oligosanthes]